MKSKKEHLSDQELAAYYDAQSDTEIVQEIERTDWQPLDIAIERSDAEATSLSLPPDVMARVKRIAKRQGVSYQTLVQRWVEERIEQELPLP